jgi:23S rRNA (guanosine2251-2'-O)-methyltransferase
MPRQRIRKSDRATVTPWRHGRKSTGTAAPQLPKQTGAPRKDSAAARRDSVAPRNDAVAPRREGGVWLYGIHAVRAALGNSRRRCRKLILASPEIQASLADLTGRSPQAGRGPAIEMADRRRIETLLPTGAVHQGVALSVDPLAQPDLETFLEQLAAAPSALLVALDQVTDPQNVGAIMRTAAAFGADAILVPDRHSAPESGVLVKAASGAFEALPMIDVGNLSQTLVRLTQAGFHSVGLAAEAPAHLDSQALPARLALVLGAEGTGLRRLTRERCTELRSIPLARPGDSLNVSTAAAIALFEASRRNRTS